MVTRDRGRVDLVATDLVIGSPQASPKPELWVSENYARDWYQDALDEAHPGSGPDARRREILFATCFAESFIIEWARNKLTVKPINSLIRKVDGCSLRKKWETVLQELHGGGKIKKCPRLKPQLDRLAELVKYRNGLVHALGSRPANDKQAPQNEPFPRKKDLQSLPAGWAVQIVFDLVSELCNRTDERVPTYLKER